MPRRHCQKRSHSGRPRLGALVLVALLGGTATSCGEPARPVPVVEADPDDVPDRDAFDFSNVVEIRMGAVSPAQAVAVVDQEIIFRNTTDVVQQLRSTNGTLGDPGLADSGPIQPGGEFRFRQSTPISITYEVSSQPGVTGRIQVDPGIESI